jgi:hypothetical protein
MARKAEPVAARALGNSTRNHISCDSISAMWLRAPLYTSIAIFNERFCYKAYVPLVNIGRHKLFDRIFIYNEVALKVRTLQFSHFTLFDFRSQVILPAHIAKAV